MTQVYGVQLVAEESADTHAQLAVVADVVGRWARIGNPLESAEGTGRRGGRARTELLRSDKEDLEIWTLRLVHADISDSSVQWAVLVTAIRHHSLEVSVQLDRTRIDSVVSPLRDKPMPPGCIPALLASASIVFSDGAHRLTTDVLLVTEDNAADFSRLVMNPNRKLPVFAFTPRDDDPIDGGLVLPALMGLAHVALVQSTASWELDKHLPPGHNVYGGAARLYWPGVTSRSVRWDHPLWTADYDARSLEAEAVALITEAGLTRSFLDPRLIRLRRQQRDAEAEKQLGEIQRLRGEFVRVSEVNSRESARSSNVALDEAVLRLGEAESRAIETFRREAEESLALAIQSDGEATEQRLRAVQAEKASEFWKSEVQRIRDGVATHANLDLSPEEEFTREIRNEIASRGEMDGERTREFIIGPQFLSRLDLSAPHIKGKVIKACADLAIAAPSLLSRRDDHALRTSDGGNTPARRRESDGAEARRCSIEQRAPSARRIHYWVIASGLIELASVNVHDDMNIPD